MDSTSILHFPYPDESDANDVPAHMAALAGAIEQSMIRQGALESRPAAGVRGRVYFADTWIEPGSGARRDLRVFYRDNGATWDQISPSVWQEWNPSFAAVDAGGVATASFTTTVTGQYSVYRLLPAGQVEMHYEATVIMDGTNPGWGGLRFLSLPVDANNHENPLICHFQDDLNRLFLPEVGADQSAADEQHP